MASTHSFPNTGTEDRRKPNLVVTERDIVFNCPRCRGELVVDCEGAGMEVPCSHCGQPLIVPAFQAQAALPTAPAAVAMPGIPAGQRMAAVPAEGTTASPVATVNETPATPATAPRVVTNEPVLTSALAAPPRTFDHSGQTAEQLDRRLGELKHQLKENRSQDTEMRGHVNRATMELHRLQLRLKKLQERHGDIQAELSSIQEHLGHSAT